MAPQVVRPKLLRVPQSECVHVRMDLGDVLAHEGMRALALKARQAPVLLTTSQVGGCVLRSGTGARCVRMSACLQRLSACLKPVSRKAEQAIHFLLTIPVPCPLPLTRLLRTWTSCCR